MKITTKLFKEIEVDEDKLINFPQGIIGFPELKDFLLANGVKTMIYYTLMLHLQPAYSQFATGKLPVAESLQNEVISLPIDSEITDNDIDTICNLIREWDRQN